MTYPLEPTGVNLLGGGYHWQFDTQTITARLEVMSARGGILAGCSSINTSRNELGSNSNENGMTGGTDFAIWWKVIAYDSTTGAGTCNFYARKPTPGVKRPQDQDAYLWGSARWTAGTESIRIGIRPTQGLGGASTGKYVIIKSSCLVFSLQGLVCLVILK